MDRWVENKSDHYYYIEFHEMKRSKHESILQFNQIFTKGCHKISVEIKPSENASKVSCSLAHKLDFTFLLLERRSPNLTQMFVESPFCHVLVPSKSLFFFLFYITNKKETLFLQNEYYFFIGIF